MKLFLFLAVYVIACLSEVSESCSVMSDLYSPWDSPGQNTGVGTCSLLQGSSQLRDQTKISRIAGT